MLLHLLIRGGAKGFGAILWIGVLQGDPNAMMLLACALDVHIVRITLRLRPRERGFAWADDTTWKLHSILRLIIVLTQFGALELYSNLYLSRGKCNWLQALAPSVNELHRWREWAAANGWGVTHLGT